MWMLNMLPRWRRLRKGQTRDAIQTVSAGCGGTGMVVSCRNCWEHPTLCISSNLYCWLLFTGIYPLAFCVIFSSFNQTHFTTSGCWCGIHPGCHSHHPTNQTMTEGHHRYHRIFRGIPYRMGPPVVMFLRWFINHEITIINYSYIYHKP